MRDELNYCSNCHVYVDPSLEKCPLCRTPLTDHPTDNDMYAPVAPPPGRTEHEYYTDLLVFLSFVFIVGACLLNIFTWNGTPWCVAVASSIIYVWIILKTTESTRYSFGFCVLAQLLGLTGLLVSLDYLVGWSGWSISYMLPLLLTGCLVSMDLYSYVHKSRWKANLLYAFLFVVLGFVPLIFYFTGMTHVLWPMILCVVASGLTLLGILRFAVRTFALEMKKRFHV